MSFLVSWGLEVRSRILRVRGDSAVGMPGSSRRTRIDSIMAFSLHDLVTVWTTALISWVIWVASSPSRFFVHSQFGLMMGFIFGPLCWQVTGDIRYVEVEQDFAGDDDVGAGLGCRR